MFVAGLRDPDRMPCRRRFGGRGTVGVTGGAGGFRVPGRRDGRLGHVGAMAARAMMDRVSRPRTQRVPVAGADGRAGRR